MPTVRAKRVKLFDSQPRDDRRANSPAIGNGYERRVCATHSTTKTNRQNPPRLLVNMEEGIHRHTATPIQMATKGKELRIGDLVIMKEHRPLGPLQGL